MYGKTLADFPGRLDAFLDEFRTAKLDLLEKAFAQAQSGIREFPAPADIRRFYNNLGESVQPAKEILQREDKPTDWGGIGKRNGISAEQIEEWMEEGKERQNEMIAKLEADPEWRRTAERLGAFPGLSKRETVPMTESERKVWATKQAKELGWKGEEG